MTLSIAVYIKCRYVEFCFAECRILCIVMLNVIMLNVVILNVGAL
jgi:hypothetical protein